MFSNNEALLRVSHELRNPLNAILAFGQLLALDELSEPQRHSVEQIIAGGRHLMALVEDLLDLSRVASGNLELSERVLEVTDEVAQALAMCGALATERSLTVSVEAGEGPLWALADQRRLKQILLNLTSNAIKYNRPGGSVVVRVARNGDDRVQVEVADTGVGMSEDQLGRLFKPFERLDAASRGVEGNGLGLAVSKALAEAMGGSIEVTSSPGAGSSFSLLLPAPSAVATAKAAAPAVAPRRRSGRVLAPAA